MAKSLTAAEEVSLWRRIGAEPDYRLWAQRKLVAAGKPLTDKNVATMAEALEVEFGVKDPKA